MKRILRIGSGALGLAALMGSSLARGDEPRGTATEPPRWDPIAQRNAVGADITLNSAEIVGSAIDLVPWLHYEIKPKLFADAYLPFTMNIGGPDLDNVFGRSEAHAALGNPTIGLHYASTADKLTWFAGGRISLPLSAFHDRGYQYADSLALISYAAYDSWLWAPEYLPLSLTAGLEYRVIEPVYLRASIDPVLLISTSDVGYALGRRHGSIFATQIKVEAEGRSKLGLGGGLAMLGVFQLTHVPGDESVLNDDQAQIAVSPFVSYDNGSIFGRFALLLALDHPLGFGFEHSSGLNPTTAALQLTIGKHLR